MLVFGREKRGEIRRVSWNHDQDAEPVATGQQAACNAKTVTRDECLDTRPQTRKDPL